MQRLILLLIVLSAPYGSAAFADPETKPDTDLRNLRNGRVIPDEGYCDQPYTVITKDGNWLCTLTTGPGKESERGQHVVATISTDQGRNWSKLIDIEPSLPDGPETSWVMPLATPGGRVYAFYNYNADNITSWRGQPICGTLLGWYVYKFSDDHGRTWSKKRYRLPMRMIDLDRNNMFGGEIQMFWGIGKPITIGGTALFAFSRIGQYQIDNSEGWFFRSDNVLSEPDPEKIIWQLLPDGDHGLQAPQLGHIQSEQNIVALSDGTLYCMYRTTLGYPAHAYSHDGGRTWTRPEFATYTPGGKRMKNPRACPRIWKTANGKFLFWYHNHSTPWWLPRNPAWISGGVEKDGKIHWSQPEILLYDPDPLVRTSYPDLIEQDGRYWITETQKSVARVHAIDPTLIEGLWNQGRVRKITTDGLVAGFTATEKPLTQIPMPLLPDLSQGGGFSIDFWITLADLLPGQVILDNRIVGGKGFKIITLDEGRIRIELRDGQGGIGWWDCDPGLLQPGKLHHVAVIVDAGPQIISFVVDGVLCDGGQRRTFGWGRFPYKLFADELADVNGAKTARIMTLATGRPGLKCLRIYNRYLRTSQAVANYHAGPGTDE